MIYTNPIIRGFYPDPSICYANGYYYIVCSSFQYFPGLPIFMSKDLINWEPIGHCLTRKSQLDLTDVDPSCGLFAPTIRYNNGRFYVVVTNISINKNFYVFTDDITGEWSEPIFINRPGIDPSFLFHENKVYFTSNGEDDFGVSGISLCEINIDTGEILTKSKCISQGTGGRFIEAPHIYHIGEYFYLLVAEGGTEYGHMECVLRSKEIYGPYESCPHNPILTNRNLGGYFIQGSGHGDLIEDKNNQWWMVHLAFRQIDKWRQFHHLGREVFIEPVFFTEDSWIAVGDDGTSRGSYEIENGICTRILETEYPKYKWSVNKIEACFVRCPNYDNYIFQSFNTFFLKGSKENLSSKGNVTFLGMRQREFICEAEVSIDTNTMIKGQQAGMTVYMDEGNHYDLLVLKDDDFCNVACVFYIGSMTILMDEIKVKSSEVMLKIESNAEFYSFFGKGKNGVYCNLGKAETKYVSSEVAEGFTGVIIAAFSIANHENKSGFVKFMVH